MGALLALTWEACGWDRGGKGHVLKDNSPNFLSYFVSLYNSIDLILGIQKYVTEK